MLISNINKILGQANC